MSKIKLAFDVVEDLRQLAGSIENLAKSMKDGEASFEAKVQEPKSESITIEKVRAVLAEKSQSGKQPEVKELITKFGANKLTDIDPAKFAELLKEAEAL